MTPNANELKIGTHVIAHWSGVSAYLAGTIAKIEGAKYHVLYDDGDKGSNRIEQMRILKPPLYFGKLTFVHFLLSIRSIKLKVDFLCTKQNLLIDWLFIYVGHSCKINAHTYFSASPYFSHTVVLFINFKSDENVKLFPA